MPDETRDLIFDTINFVRKLPETIDATGAFIFAPYHGTPLRTLAIEKGYLNDDEICSLSNTSESMLRMPTITKEEISGIAKVFSFYIKFPESRWDDIKIAESETDEGIKMFKKTLQIIYSPLLTFLILFIISCEDSEDSDLKELVCNGAYSTATIMVDINEEVYNNDESVKAYSRYSWTSDGTSRKLSGNGIPNHEVGTFPNSNNPNTCLLYTSPSPRDQRGSGVAGWGW